MIWLQKTLTLTPKSRGFHLVTREVLAQLPELAGVKTGLAHFFLKHSSASLSINENADPDVRQDMETWSSHVIPDGSPLFIHTCEGPDDMPAHIKSAIFGCELTIPVSSGELVLGTWQGLYLGEHRDYGGSRKLVVTITGTGE
jgi:secondary thiamine-phosphate synthase enzyme